MNELVRRLASEAGLEYEQSQEDAVKKLCQLVAKHCINQCGSKGVCVGAGLTKTKIFTSLDIQPNKD
jgi:hypothetical protein